MKKIVAILMAMIMVISVTVVLAGGADKETQTNFKKVIVGFDESPNKADEKMIRDCGGKTKYTYHIINAKAVEIPEQAIENIKKNQKVEYVVDDSVVHAAVGEVTPWGVDRIGADLVWSNNKGNGVKVAIIDTGIDKDHPDLQANIKGGFNFVSNHHRRPADPEKWDDDNGHGTHCAGIVAAVDNDIGVIGVAPEAYLYGVKVLDRTGSGYESDVIAGIQWSRDNGMQVISMSLSSSSDSSPLHEACDKAYYDAGIVVVAAAGNSGPRDNTVLYPAKYESVIAVSATDDGDSLAGFSSIGPEVELAAPGVSIYSTYKGGGYATMEGTSMACPHVAGTAALVIGSRITGSGAVRTHLGNTAENLGAPGKDNLYGYGLVDAFKAAGGEDITPPTISDLTPAAAFVNTGTPTISATVTDASAIEESSIVMRVDGAKVIHSYESETGIVSYTPTTTLAEGSHTVVLEVSDTASNQATESWSFTVDPTHPAQVTGLTVTTVSSSQLDLAWTANSDADHYNVYRSMTSGSSYALIASPTTTSYSDTGLEASTSYYYTVSAVDSSDNEGEASVEKSGTTSEAGGDVMHVSDIDMRYDTGGPNYFIYTTVTIVDSNSASVPEATVYLETTLPDGSTVSDSGSTNGEGTATFKLKSRQTGTYTSTVTNVEKSGWDYDPTGETSKMLPVL